MPLRGHVSSFEVLEGCHRKGEADPLCASESKWEFHDLFQHDIRKKLLIVQVHQRSSDFPRGV